MRSASTLILCFTFLLTGCASSTQHVNNVHEVTPGLLVRAAQPSDSGFEALKDEYHIRTVVNLNDRTTQSEATITRKLDLAYVPIPSSALSPQRDKLMAFLVIVSESKQNAPVLVHCQYGMDRTGLAVAVYRMIIQGWSRDDALRELRQYQSFTHAMVFNEIPEFIDQVDRNRESWKAELAGILASRATASASR